MIFTKVDALVKDIDVDKYHIETVILSSDDLNKKIIRVKSDHGNEFGIRLDRWFVAVTRGLQSDLQNQGRYH